jgi:enoyl-CoA hydratase
LSSSNGSQVVVPQTEGAVAILKINRPQALNALNHAIMKELESHLERLEADDNVRCVIITGDEKAFAAGADIKEMDQAGVVDPARDAHLARWDKLGRFKKPVIAAVSGFCLGGGMELAMACDLIVASESASFGQPEISIGVIPGAGGTQRLTRLVGKGRALDLVLTGRRISAQDALAWGLVCKLAPVESYLEAAKGVAREIAAKSPLAAQAAKEAVRAAFELPLEQGLVAERRIFNALFATEDQKEGMRAFVEKRKPAFKGK